MKIYMMGICGTAMAQVALLLRDLGHEIMGSDQNFLDPIAGLLKKNHIASYIGYDVQRLIHLNPDAVIVGNVISRGNPELEFLLDSQRFPFYSFPAFLEQNLFRQRNMWVVSGTHGKTTTSALLAYALTQLDLKPGYLIGGIPKNFDSGYALGDASVPFVIEGDEYDTAFFDKRSKFFHYWPRTLILNNIELDHADIFRDLQEIQRTFYQLTRMLPQHGHLILNGDDKNALDLLPCDWTQVHTVGVSDKNQWQICNFSETTTGIFFDLYHQKQCIYKQISLPIWGIFNAKNAAMAYVACHVNGFSLTPQLLNGFKGVARRQTLLKESESLILMEDFGHHPSAIHATLQALKQRYPTHHLIACFEPACNTSASIYFQRQAHYAFKMADEVWLLPPKAHVYSDRFVHALPKMDMEVVAQALQQQNKAIRVLTHYEQMASFLKNIPSRPTLFCAFSNGKLSEFLHQNI